MIAFRRKRAAAARRPHGSLPSGIQEHKAGDKEHDAHRQGVEHGFHRVHLLAELGLDGDLCEDAARNGQRHDPRHPVQAVDPCGDPVSRIEHCSEEKSQDTGEQQCRVDVAADQRELFPENYQQQKTYGNNNSNHKMPPLKNLF